MTVSVLFIFDQMQQLELLTRLPTSLSCAIFQEWLTPRSIAAMDTACCCKRFRQTFLNLLQADEYAIRAQVTIFSSSKIFNVLHRIGGKLRNVAFNDELTPEQGLAVRTHCQNLEHVCIKALDSCSLQLWTLVQENSSIKRLAFETRYIHYCGPPGTFLSYAELHETIKAFWADWPKDLVYYSKLTSGIVKLNLSAAGIHSTTQTMLQIAQLCPNLTSLGLNFTCDFDEHTVLVLATSCKYIECFNLVHANLSHTSLILLTGLYPNLTSLGLMGVKLTDHTLDAITTACPRIVHLDLGRSLNISDDGILRMVQNLTRLQSLNLQTYSRLTDQSIQHLLAHCTPTLHTLYLNCYKHGPLFQADSINALLERCTQLHTFHLEMSRQEEISFIFVFTPAAVVNLKTIELSGSFLMDQNCAIIGQYATKLRVLSLSSYLNCSYASMNSLYQGCAHLSELYCEKLYDYPDCFLRGKNSDDIQFDMSLWEKTRPGVIIGRKAPRSMGFNVTGL